MDRRTFMKSAGIVTAATAAAAGRPLADGLLSRALFRDVKPNIIFILADDYGIGEVGCYGGDNYPTPRIDGLARTGVRFTHAFTPSLCGPSRAAIMTGRYAFRTGATNQVATGRMKPSDETFIPACLKRAGYVSSCIGKWGQLPRGPELFGFDDYFMFKSSGIYWNTQPNGKTYVVNGETRTLHDKEYMPDLMHQHLVSFLSQHLDKPFFVYYSLSHIHTQILPTPDSAPGTEDHYADNIAYMDKLIGKLLDELDRTDLRKKTLVVFFGDNGPTGGRVRRATIGGRILDGSKGSMQEGGNRVPLIASWPGTAPEGRVSDALIDSTDFLPTFAELAGAALPSNRVMDGRSFASTLLGTAGKGREWVFLQLARKWYVRDRAWKLDQSGSLYDMKDAPFSQEPVSVDSKDPEALAARARLQAVLDELNPSGGILDDGDGTGRKPGKEPKKKSRKAAKRPTN